jgi:hypothetical protein
MLSRSSTVTDAIVDYISHLPEDAEEVDLSTFELKER